MAPAGETTVFDAIVVAGGGGRRLGGIDKPALVIAGRPLLDTALVACAGARSTVVVGPRRATCRGVIWTVEDPPGGGPMAALAAGLDALPDGAEIFVAMAADLPAVTERTVARLVRAATHPDARSPVADGAVVVDQGGRRQPLLAVYRRAAVRHAISTIGDPTGQPIRRLAAQLDLVEISDPVAAADIDTPAQLANWQEASP